MAQSDQQLYSALKATSLISAASVVNLLVGVARSKAFALFLGAAGVGLTGLYYNIMFVFSLLFEGGVGMAVVREMARDVAAAERARIHRAILWMMACMAVLCAAAIWILSQEIATRVVNDADRSADMAYLAIGAAAFLASRVLTGVLQGQKRTGFYAIVVGVGGLCGTIPAIALSAIYGADLIPLIVICTPIATLLVAMVLVWKARPRLPEPIPFRELSAPARGLIRLGVILMVSYILQHLVVLYLRAHIIDNGGLAVAGFFHAGWTVALLYMTLVTQSLGTDYFPRLTGQIDTPAAVATVNQGLLVGLLITVPMVIGTIGGAGLALTLFFSSEFVPAAALLQFLSLGNIFKAMSIALAYVAMAKGWRFVYLGFDLVMNAAFLGLSLVFYDSWGLMVIGMAYCLGYGLHAGCAFLVARRAIGLRLDGPVRVTILLGLGLAVLTLAAALWRPEAGLAVGAVALAISGIYSLRLLARILPPEGRLGRLIARLNAWVPLIGR